MLDIMMLCLKNVCTNTLAIRPVPFHAIRNIFEAIKRLQSTRQLLKDHQLAGKFHSVCIYFMMNPTIVKYKIEMISKLDNSAD